MTSASDDPAVRRSARAVLALGIVAGIAHAVETLLFAPAQLGIATDVYYHAARAALAGEDVYAATPPGHPNYTYIYPPAVLVAFFPHALLGSATAAFALQTALNVAAGVGVGVVLVRALSRRGVRLERLDYALVVGFALLSVHAVLQLVQGQTTLWLALALAVGFDALERGRETLAGVAFAGAALVKVFPAAVGLWLLRRRSWRAVTVAVATGCGALVAGALAFGPDLTLQYFGEVLLGRFEESTFDGTPDPERTLVTARRQLAALGVGSGLLTPAVIALLAPFVAASYRRIDADERRLAAILATLVATLLALPLQALYFSLLAYPLVLLLYRLPPGRARSAIVAGTLLTFVMIGYEVVAVAVELLPLPEALASGILTVAASVFTFVLPPTIGMWLLLAGCVLVQFDLEPSRASDEDESSIETGSTRPPEVD